jgi:PhnB protein
MEIVPNLHFNGDCEKAIELYEQAFGATRIVFLRYKDANPLEADQEGNAECQEYIYHAEIIVGNQRIMLNDHISDIPCGINVSMLILFDSAEEVEKAYEILKAEAKILAPITETNYSSCFVSLIDRYGVRWELMKER